MPMILRNTDILFNSNAVLASPPGTAPMFAARAWVNFKGTGTVAIRGSGNVSSVVRNVTGRYTVNFATAMPDANYALSGMGRDDQGACMAIAPGGIPAVGSIAVATVNPNVSTRDTDFASVVIFR